MKRKVLAEVIIYSIIGAVVVFALMKDSSGDNIKESTLKRDIQNAIQMEHSYFIMNKSFIAVHGKGIDDKGRILAEDKKTTFYINPLNTIDITPRKCLEGKISYVVKAINPESKKQLVFDGCVEDKPGEPRWIK